MKITLLSLLFAGLVALEALAEPPQDGKLRIGALDPAEAFRGQGKVADVMARGGCHIGHLS